jgi:hypothetical protein
MKTIKIEVEVTDEAAEEAERACEKACDGIFEDLVATPGCEHMTITMGVN